MLHVHRSSRADYLAEALGEVLAARPIDALQREVVSVPTRGVERWLAQELSHHLGAAGPLGLDGICANIDWPFPGALVSSVVSAAMGRAVQSSGTPAGWSEGACSDPWAPEQAVWPLIEILDEHLDDPELAPVAAHLRASSPPMSDGTPPRRFAFARHVADLFDRYGVHRPEMLLAWAQGRMPLGQLGMGREPDMAWQYRLWALLRERLGVPSPAEDAEVALALVRQSPELLDLPDRLSCFGLTRLPEAHLRALVAVAEGRDVHLFLLHPSPALWDRAAHACAGTSSRPLRTEDPTARSVRNPLLASWGRDSREMQVVLAVHGVSAPDVRLVAEPPKTVLGLLQAAVQHDLEPEVGEAADCRTALKRGDGSLVLHSCHGRARQVEVVREAVLHLLAEDPSLEPRDVIVMCPDIEQFAPLVTAVLGTAVEMGAPELRARLADRSVRQTNPMLAVAAHLLELASGRASASELLDFASREPVRRRFGLDEDDLARLEGWLAGAGVRWGVDAGHRAEWKLGGLEEGTWRAGMDRLLLGVAMTSERGMFAGILPYDDVASAEADLMGRIAELVNRLSRVLGDLQGRHSAAGWADRLAAGTELLGCPPRDELWQSDQLGRVLAGVAAEAVSSPTALIDIAEAGALLADKLKGRPTRANFRTGDMTVCTLVPMRSVPHRVVCLLGMDDGVFPRRPEDDGDDLTLAAPMVGDRDAAGEDRQLLLDAVLAAKGHLIVTFEGHDQHLNQRKPPCVPVAELLDAVDRTIRFVDGRQAREVLVVEHPLQAFDKRNYRPGALYGPGPWRYDSVNLEASRQLGRQRKRRSAFMERPLAPVRPGPVAMAALTSFVEHPVRAFLRLRLGYYPGNVAGKVSDSLSLELAPLERWALGDRLLSAAAQGRDFDMAVAAELGRGLLPPGPLAKRPLAEVSALVASLLQRAAELPGFEGEARPMDIEVRLRGGRALTGGVPGVVVDPKTGHVTIVRLTYSRLGSKHRLRAWVQFLALSAARPDLLPSAMTIGQSEGSKPERPRIRVAWLSPLARDAHEVRTAAIQRLEELVDLFDRGMREPLPIYCATSGAWAAACRAPQGDGPSPREAARQCWQPSNEEFPGERREPEHLAVLGGALDFADLLEWPPAEDEQGLGWDDHQPTRFGRLAVRLWSPLLGHEQLVAR